jgi:hypothetical protein
VKPNVPTSAWGRETHENGCQGGFVASRQPGSHYCGGGLTTYQWSATRGSFEPFHGSVVQRGHGHADLPSAQRAGDHVAGLKVQDRKPGARRGVRSATAGQALGSSYGAIAEVQRARKPPVPPASERPIGCVASKRGWQSFRAVLATGPPAQFLDLVPRQRDGARVAEGSPGRVRSSTAGADMPGEQPASQCV